MQYSGEVGIMSTINESIRYPMERDEWYKTIIIGGILSLFSFLIIPILLVYGFIIRVIQSRLAGQRQPPEFGDWATLLVDGVKVAIIGFVYLLIPLIVAAFTIGGALMSIATGTEAGAAVGLAGLFGGFLLSSLLVLIFGYIAVAAIVNFARTEQFGDAFDFGTIKQVIFHSDYAIAWLTAVVVLIVAGIVAGMLNIIPILGWVVAAFVYFYAQIVAAGIWADGFEAAREGADVSGHVVSDDPAV